MDKLEDEIRFGLEEALPGMRKTILKKLPLAVAAMIQARTPNTMELSALLPLGTERADMREQWLRRLLTNRLIRSGGVLEPFARRALEQATAGGQRQRNFFSVKAPKGFHRDIAISHSG